MGPAKVEGPTPPLEHCIITKDLRCTQRVRESAFADSLDYCTGTCNNTSNKTDAESSALLQRSTGIGEEAVAGGYF